MASEPSVKRAFVFVDGQNLFHAAREAFGYTYPNYDVRKLAESVCRTHGWRLEKVAFYTGVPDPQDDRTWSEFWQNKLAQMGRQDVQLYSRSLRYRSRVISLPDGSQQSLLVGNEKGIDIRIALDVIRAVRLNECDVVVLFSQDQDFSEVAEELRKVSQEQRRWMKIASAFPVSPTTGVSRRGIDKTDWIRIDKLAYDACIDTRDYRPKKSGAD